MRLLKRMEHLIEDAKNNLQDIITELTDLERELKNIESEVREITDMENSEEMRGKAENIYSKL